MTRTNFYLKNFILNYKRRIVKEILLFFLSIILTFSICFIFYLRNESLKRTKSNLQIVYNRLKSKDKPAFDSTKEFHILSLEEIPSPDEVFKEQKIHDLQEKALAEYYRKWTTEYEKSINALKIYSKSEFNTISVWIIIAVLGFFYPLRFSILLIIWSVKVLLRDGTDIKLKKR